MMRFVAIFTFFGATILATISTLLFAVGIWNGNGATILFAMFVAIVAIVFWILAKRWMPQKSKPKWQKRNPSFINQPPKKSISKQQKRMTPQMSVLELLGAYRQYRVKYKDAYSNVTTRDIFVIYAEKLSEGDLETDYYINVWCYLKSGIRTFYSSRIMEVIDLKTKKKIGNLGDEWRKNIDETKWTGAPRGARADYKVSFLDNAGNETAHIVEVCEVQHLGGDAFDIELWSFSTHEIIKLEASQILQTLNLSTNRKIKNLAKYIWEDRAYR